MNRREFLSLCTAIGLIAVKRKGLASLQHSVIEASEQTRQRFYELLDLTRRKKWGTLPIGEFMGELGRVMLGTPYVAGTLEGELEQCRINLNAVDCVTFFEYLLAFARTVKKNLKTFEDFATELLFIRYRGGILKDYTSRLHYMADWIIDNISKNVVEDITPAIGGIPYPLSLSFMSSHPDLYPALTANPQLIDSIRKIELSLQSQKLFYIPKDQVAQIEKKLLTGDILAFTTAQEGLDYGHTGIVYKYNDHAYLLHASTKYKKVYMDDRISLYLQKSTTLTGLTAVRPLEPVKT